MSILTRYLIRAHLGPFLFSLGVLTGLLFLNAIAQRLDLLVGKGLGAAVIGEFLLLSLPHTFALTLPMAVLIAVLYSFADFAASSEITALAAGGIKPTRLLRPMVVMGAILAGVTFYFNDRVLPEANHRLKNLMVDIGNKSPTFQLREQVVNPIEAGDRRSVYYLQANQIDQATSELTDVAIYDVSDPGRHRTIYADHGVMAFNAARTDLYLTLTDGIVYEADDQRQGSLQKTRFATQVIPVRGVADELQRNAGADVRSDREMSIRMLLDEARAQRTELIEVQRQSAVRSEYAIERALGIKDGEDAAVDETAVDGGGVLRGALMDDEITRSVALSLRTNATREQILIQQQNRYWVEIHKKLAISVACIIFVLIGLPLGLRFPRGGVGMVISFSVAIFGVYWMALIGGENIADKGIVRPWIAMWAADAVFFLIAVPMVFRLGRSVATTRGGGWDDLRHTLTSLFRRSRRGAPSPQPVPS